MVTQVPNKISYQQRFNPDIISVLPGKKTDGKLILQLKTPLYFQSCPMNYNGDNAIQINNQEMANFIKVLEMQITEHIAKHSEEIFGAGKLFTYTELVERMDRSWELEEQTNVKKTINTNMKVKGVDNTSQDLSCIKNKIYVMFKIDTITFTKTTFQIDYIQIGIKEHLSRIKSQFKNYFEIPEPIVAVQSVSAETDTSHDIIKIQIPKQFF